ncbi:MAG: hypothetical protein WC919_04740 [Candidatus Paceibacterota bacterium]|jgi:hypothetical protein
MLAPRANFLHSHNHLRQNPDHEHVVVDRADWEKARRILLTTGTIEEANRKLAQLEEYKSYDFCVVLDDGTVITNEIVGALLAAGCDDGTIASSGTRTWVRFTREAESLEVAIKSAVDDVRKANCCTVVRIEMDADFR